MHILITVNALAEVTADQTTWDLAQALREQGHEVGLADVDGLGCAADGGAVALWYPCAESPAATCSGQAERRRLDALDRVLIRFNPGREGRPWAMIGALSLLARAARDVEVVNRPTGLLDAMTKIYSARLPAWTVPETVITRRAADVVALLDAHPEGVVIKPASGTRGRGVFHLLPGDRRNLNQLLELSFEAGYVMAQRYLPAARQGDVRVHVIDGQIVQADGRYAAVARVPSGADFRSNVHVGAVPQRAALTQRHHDLVAAVGPQLVADGLRWVGLDVVGDHIIEVNAFSPGGLTDASRFEGVDFLSATIAALF